MKNARAIVVMGVSGCGKTSVAEGLAASLGAAFIEGDSLHPAANVDKMSHGIALTDEDRWPWLDTVGRAMADVLAGNGSVVVSCSALKKAYRDRLRFSAGGELAFVFLKGSRELLMSRMAAREGHFMPVSLLDSQLATLQDPSGEPGVVTVDIDASIEAIVASALDGLNR
ncbi:gluconokinase [Shinella zoogloeoides]|uniref:Gluconokinase n=1 Tax=Shinella zoogloeoides TaxID=352475 RepID=A0A6N8TEK6_SHIZO|nr:gluconokinase [Shinella zoogloeoides]MXO01707.1 AAA family ATPase [Shinella zoogloeoides]UEX82152.1 gluconokinase [Shinella zoogloeoides]